MKKKTKLSKQNDGKSNKDEKHKVSHSETGHANNVANFEVLISYCIGYGTEYDTVNPKITISALREKHDDAVRALENINKLLPAFVNAVNNRQIIFQKFPALIRRVHNAVAASDVDIQFVDDVKSITRKLLGKRASKKAAVPESDNADSTGQQLNYHSSSQMSYDLRIENFYKLIQLLKIQPKYTPNEADLTINALTALHSKMVNSNTKVIKAYTLLCKARQERNVVLYHEETGLVIIASNVKRYVKSVFGISSPEFKQISKILFKARI